MNQSVIFNILTQIIEQRKNQRAFRQSKLNLTVFKLWNNWKHALSNENTQSS